MSQLTLTKTYADTELLYADDIHSMWDELEAKVNGNIDADNLASGWATLDNLTLALGEYYTLGATDSSSLYFNSSTDDWCFTNSYNSGDTIFKVAGTEVARIEATSNNLEVQKDLYFKDKNTTYGLFRLLGTYQKPVLTYVSATLFDMENNTETANESLVCFPTGPIAVTENTGSTTKFRRLDTTATANGYGSTHTGAADSGLRVGLSLSANTWYFVYAARVRYGDDAGNKFIMVLDDTSPAVSNESTLNGRYGTGEWLYLGTVRRGFYDTATTTFIAFQQDHQGWTYFIDRGTADDYLGIRVNSTSVSSTSNTAVYTMGIGNSGDDIPANIVAVKIDMSFTADGDGDMTGNVEFGLSTSSILSSFQSFEEGNGIHVHAYTVKLPVISGAVISARRSSDSSDEDYNMKIYVSGFLDHYV